MSEDLAGLKSLGHQLLDEYIALDTYRGSTKAEKKHAYRKLAMQLKTDEWEAHFGVMNEKQHILRAIKKLEKMIRKRKAKIEHLGLDKRQYAPNLRELQKQASNLNKL